MCLGNSNSPEQIGLASPTGKKFPQFRGSLSGSWANLPPTSLSRNRPFTPAPAKHLSSLPAVFALVLLRAFQILLSFPVPWKSSQGCLLFTPCFLTGCFTLHHNNPLLTSRLRTIALTNGSCQNNAYLVWYSRASSVLRFSEGRLGSPMPITLAATVRNSYSTQGFKPTTVAVNVFPSTSSGTERH